MANESHAPGWRGRPKHYRPLLGIDERDANWRRVVEEGEKLEAIAAVGCGLGALACLGAAAIVWADPAIAWIRAVLS